MKPVLDHHQALSKAKIQLMARPDSVFFTTVCFSLKHLWNDNIPTAQTNGTWVEYNPKFFMSLDVQEQVFLLLHESMHVAYLHMDRFREGMDRDRANIAMDHVINLQLIGRGFKMPACGYADPQYVGMCWEEVYKLLPKNLSEPMMRDLVPSDLPSSALEQQVQDILVRAQIQSKMAGDKPGTIPGDIQIFLDRLLNPKLPWNRILQKYLHAFAKNDYSFRKPNRRFFPKYHLPSLVGERLIDLAIAVDTSGSVSDADFLVFVTEVSSILRMMNPENITLVQFDISIKSETKIRNIKELMQCKFTGRGGTCITPVLEWANKKHPQLLLVFSDGEFIFYGTETKVPTLWVVHNDPEFTPPFGKVIHYTI